MIKIIASSILAFGIGSSLAQAQENRDPLLQINTVCGVLEIVRNGVQEKLDGCVLQDGKGKVYYLRDGESVQIGPQIWTRKGTSFERKLAPTDGAKIRADIDAIKACVDKAVADGVVSGLSADKIFENKRKCLQK